MRNYWKIFILSAALAVAACGGKESPDVKPSAPSAPTSLVVFQSGDNSLTFQWDKMENATSYEWVLTQGGAEVQKGTVTARNVTVSGLDKGTAYRFGVRALSANGTSSWSYADASTTGKPVAQQYAEFKIPSWEEDGVVRAFPGAEGGGMFTTGGRGGQVIHVTNLNDSGSGSLRAALEQSGKRIIVFDVAGTITLKSDLKISKGDVTVAGQTAPGDGICLRDYTVNIQASNVIIRFLRFRLGDEAPWTDAEIAAHKADGEDAIWGRRQDNIILDHCSMSWSVDESASFYQNENFTLQWCLIAESMKECKLHSKGSHGYGGIWGGKNASFHHNLLAYHDSRNARIDHPHIYGDSKAEHQNPSRRGNVDIRNNVIYDWGSNNTYGGEGGWFNIVNNYYKKGPSSTNRNYILDLYGEYTSTCDYCGKNVDDGYPDIFVSGNKYDGNSSYDNAINWHNGTSHANYNVQRPTALPLTGRDGAAVYVNTHSAEGAMNAVCDWAGASLKKDAVDTRISADVKAGTGRIIKDIADVKAVYGYAWPDYTATDAEKARVTDTDKDGMPDWFETEFGLDKSQAGDAAGMDLDVNKRYTNLEMYLHYLVRDVVAGQGSGATYTKL